MYLRVAMNGSGASKGQGSEPIIKPHTVKQDVQKAQETIYRFLLHCVKQWPSDQVLSEFRHLFIQYCDVTSKEASQALGDIIFANDAVEFRNTLKRSCYILVNNWDATRNYSAIQDLVEIFSDPAIFQRTLSPALGRLRLWLMSFIKSKDYQNLKVFARKHEMLEIEGSSHWSQRYTSYLLVPQYVDLDNPVEEREAARELSRQLKDRFKFNLAMYIARSQSGIPRKKPTKNPTNLGDEALRLIKMIVARRGDFSYKNLANIFLGQIKDLSYKEVKQSLQQYLIFSVGDREFVKTLKLQLAEKFETLYSEHDDDSIDDAILLRTCNRMIEYLTTENHQDPSPLFILLLSQGSPLTLVVTLLKIILICKHARTHLETCIAKLIGYYANVPEEECHWMIHFMEIFNVTFAIHAENIQYNLVCMKSEQLSQPSLKDIDSYRVFSQLKHDWLETEGSSTN